ncbi:MAG: endonuclease/exonuclease/phosphatase family protein [Phycisphaeraceae bacterium]|nr:endonuclease/exonuclease/phosphatase family protein [Phycisphaeraceae bacterium]
MHKRNMKVGLWSAALIAGGLGGCARMWPESRPYPRPARAPLVEARARYAEKYPIENRARPVRIDGDHGEWAYETVALADADYVYIRFGMEGAPATLQSNRESLTLWLDLDGSALSGDPGIGGMEGLGVDLEVQFSPRSAQTGELRSGVACRVHHRDGSVTAISHGDADLFFAPTYASENYELRLSRHVDAIDEWTPSEAIRAADAVTPAQPVLGSAVVRGAGRFVLVDSAGDEIGRSDPFSFDLPPRGGHAPVSAFLVPSHRIDAIRVVSYNVLHASPVENPAPFVRVIHALDPDVLLLQEWDRQDAAQIEAWFEEHIGGAWTVVSTPGTNVAIASPHAILVPDVDPRELDGRPVRYAGAIVRTPLRDTAVASVHLKCCGSAGSEEDLRRIAEAAVVSEAFAGLASERSMLRAIGGDFNLVGTRQPLDEIRRACDGDGSDMATTEPTVLGDRAIYTWSDSASPFSPGRLDCVVYGDSTAEVASAFVLDTRRLADEALKSAGLERGDSGASDHMPVVIDLLPR